VHTVQDIAGSLQELSVHIGRLQAFEKELKLLSRGCTVRRLCVGGSPVLEIEFSSLNRDAKIVLRCVLPKGRAIYEMEMEVEILWGEKREEEIMEEIVKVKRQYGRLLHVCKRLCEIM
jgi:hypothetical protein